MFQKKRLIITGLALTLAFSLTACTNKNSGDATTPKNGKNVSATEELAPEFSYVAKSLSLPEDFDPYSAIGAKDGIYGSTTDYESGTMKFLKATISNGQVSAAQTVTEFSQNGYISKFTTDGNGNIYAVMDTYPEEPDTEDEAALNAYYASLETETKRNLIKFDANGQKAYEVELNALIEDTEYFYPQYFVADDKGRVYILCSGYGMMLFDETGKYVGKIDIEDQNSWISAMGLSKNGTVVVSNINYGEQSSSASLCEIDFDGKKIGKTYKNFPFATGNAVMAPGIEGDILVSDGSAVYEYSMEKEEATKILTWIDLDIDGNSLNTMFSVDGQLYAMSSDYNAGTVELSELTKVKTEDIVKREILTFGSIYEDSSISRKIIEFNKSNDKYRIKLKTYMDINNWSDTSYQDAIARFANDLTSGNAPDIIDLSNVDVANLVKKGALEDLMPYLEKSTKIQKSDIFESLLSNATYDGKLAYIPSGFTLETLAAKTSIVGDKMGWTVADLLNVSKQYQGSEILEYATQDSVLSMMMMLNKQAYINTSKAECYFDTQEFKDLLNFAKSFPEEYDFTNQRLTPNKLKDNSLILVDVSVYSFDEIQSVMAYFDGEPCTFIGYPTGNGGNGCALFPRDTYGISAQSKNKDAAWSFVESMIANDAADTWTSFGFSSLKSVFEQQKKEALDVDYLYDENGDIITDENGNPYYENGGGGYTMIGDDGETWDYVYKPVTPEEVAMVEKLLAGATAADFSVDQELNKIITEEAASFFKGDKSVDEVVAIIQNRVSLYLKENY